MKVRLFLAVIALVVIPTAILSLMAGQAVRVREENLDQRLRMSAAQSIKSVSDNLAACLARVQSELAAASSESVSQGQADWLVIAAEKLRAENPFMERVYVLRLPDSFLYPGQAFHSDAQAASAPDYSLLDQGIRLQAQEQRYADAAAEFERVASLAGVPAPVKAEAALRAAQCHRSMGQPALAVGLLRQIAGYTSGLHDRRHAAMSGPDSPRDADGFLHSLKAIAELVTACAEAGEREPAGDARDRWQRLSQECRIEILERLAIAYDRVVPAQRDALLAAAATRAEPSSDADMDDQFRRRRARADALLRERQSTQDFTAEERMALGAAAVAQVAEDGGAKELAWVTVNGRLYSLGRLAESGGLVGGFSFEPSGLASYLERAAAQVSDQQGMTIRIESMGGKAGDRDRARHRKESPPVLETGRLAPPFEGVVVSASLPQPGAAARGQTMRMRLQRWGITVLALGVVAGAFLVMYQAATEVSRARERTDFVAGITHDLRTPLSSLRMLAESLHLDRVEKPEKRKEFIGTMLRESRRLGHLIDRVLYFVRLGENALTYRFRPIDVGGLVREVAEPYAEVSIETGLPPVMADPDAIVQVVMNLIDNAEKYSRPRGKGAAAAANTAIAARGRDLAVPAAADAGSGRQRMRPKIEVRVERSGRSHVQIAVRDEGQGIPQTEVRRIFRRFYRAGGQGGDATPGIGLGLALCRHIVKAHRGRIEVESEVGRGSTFKVLLPVI